MRRLRQFAVIEGVAIAALVAVAAAIALAAFSLAGNQRDGAAFVWFFGTAVFGAPFVILMGAPVYWVLVQRGSTTWPPVLATGVAPGVALLFLNPGFGLMYMACGAAVASLTHWWCRRLALIRRPLDG
jgi:uncharacterized membrane protein